MAKPEQIPTHTITAPSNTKLLVLLLALGALAYANSFTVPAVFDDWRVFAGLERDQLVAKLASPSRFIVHALFLVQQDFGLDALWIQHLLNLLIHVAAAFALYQLLKVLLRRQGWTTAAPAVVAAAVFTVHPLATQAVTYICQRYTSLAGMLALAAIACYASARSRGGAASLRPWQTPRQLLPYLAGIGCAHLAMFCKEYVVALPALLLLIEWLFFSDRQHRILPRFAYLAPLLASAIWIPLFQIIAANGDLVAAASSGAAVLPDWSAGEVTRLSYLVSQAEIVLRVYLRLALLPTGLSIDHAYRLTAELWSPGALAALAGVTLLLGAALYWHRRWPFMAAAVLWFFLALAPTSSLVPNHEFVAEHRAYLALAGLGLAWPAFWRLRLRPRLRLYLLASIVAGLAGLTLLRNQVWQSPILLWEDAVAKSPNGWRAHYKLGMAYLQDKRTTDAVVQFRSALQANPNLPPVWNLLGTLYEQLSDNQRARRCYMQALELVPANGQYWFNLARLLRVQGELPPARRAVVKALELAPAAPNITYMAAVIMEDLGQYQQALLYMRQTAQLAPLSYNRAWLHCARLHLRLDQAEAALPYLSEYLAQCPDVVLAHLLQGRALCAVGRPAAALPTLRQALALTDGRLALVHYELGRALLAADNLESAAPHFYWVALAGYRPPLAEQLYRPPAN